MKPQGKYCLDQGSLGINLGFKMYRSSDKQEIINKLIKNETTGKIMGIKVQQKTILQQWAARP